MAAMGSARAHASTAAWSALVVGLVLGPLGAASADAEPPAARLTLDDAVRLATRDNPGLHAKQLEVRAVRANEVTAALRPDPVAEYRAEQLGGRSFPATDAIPQYTVSLSQLIETGGKRQHRVESARAATTVSGYELADLQRQLVAQVKKAFVAILVAQDALALARANLSNLDEVERIQAVRAQQGDISELELSRLRAQRYAFERDALDAEQALRAARITLRTLIGPDAIAEDFAAEGALALQEVPGDRAQFYRQMLDYRPDIRAAEAGQRRAQADAALARANAWWDFSPMVEYQRIGGDNTIGFGLSLPVRIFDRNQGEILRTRAEIARADALREAALIQARSDLENALSAMATEREKVLALRDVYLNQAQRIRDTVEFAYRRGGLSLLDYLDAQRSYRETSLEYLRALGAHQGAVYDLEAAVGGPLAH